MRPVVHLVDRISKGLVNVDTTYELRVVCHHDEEANVRQIMLLHVNSVEVMQIQGLSIHDTDNPDRGAVVADIFSSQRNDRRINDLVSRLSIEPTVTDVSWKRKS